MPGPRSNSARLSCCFCGGLRRDVTGGIASAQTADTILFNGKILTVDKDFSTQQARGDRRWPDPRDRRFGRDEEARRRQTAKLIDLGGRTVIPGLTDGHIHGIRAALTFGTEVNWIGVPTLKDALDKIAQAAKSQKPGSWIVVAGGWTEEQFAEKRRPTPAEVAALAPDNPVYIQHLYDWLLLSPKAMEALNIRDDARRCARRQARARRRQQADRRHRRQRRRARPDFRQAAEADHGAAGRRLQALLPRDEQPRHHRHRRWRRRQHVSGELPGGVQAVAATSSSPCASPITSARRSPAASSPICRT